MSETLAAFFDTAVGRIAAALLATAFALVGVLVVNAAVKAFVERLTAILTRIHAEATAALGPAPQRASMRPPGAGGAPPAPPPNAKGGVTAISAEMALRLVMGLARVLRIILFLVIAYAWVAQMAWAIDRSRATFGFVVDPVVNAVTSMGHELFELLPNLLVLAVFIIVARVLLDWVGALGDAVAEGRVTFAWLPPELATPTKRIAMFGVVMGTVLVALPYIPGSGSKSVQTASVAIGVLVSLNSSSVIANFMAGFVLTYSRAFRIGDRVKIGEVIGHVTHLGPFTVRVRTLKDEEVLIPNAVVQNAAWTNYSRYCIGDSGVQIYTTVTIGYQVPWRTVHRLLITAARETEGVEPTPEPYVLQRALDDFYVRYEINAFIQRPWDMHFIEARLRQNIQDCFFREGVEIMSPHYEAKRNGELPAIPDQGGRVDRSASAE